MKNLITNPWFIGFATTIVGGFIVMLIGKWRGWWWKTKNPVSIELAKRSLIIFDGEAEEKTKQLIYLTKQLGDSLVASYKTKIAHDREHETGTLSLITELLTPIKPLITELSATERELDNLKEQ